MLKTVLILLCLSIVPVSVCIAQSQEYHRLDDKIGKLDNRMDNHLEAASKLLAEIKTKLNWSIVIGATLITGLLIPWVRKKIGLGIFIFLLIGLAACPNKIEPVLEICLLDRYKCGDRCFTDKECGDICYCNREGYCIPYEINP